MGSRSISPTAMVSPGATVCEDVAIGHFAVIHDDVVLGEGSTIGVGVVIYPRVRVGRNVVVQDYAILGKQARRTRLATFGPQDADTTEIHDDVTIGARATVFAGCQLASGVFLGDGAFLREGCVVGPESVIGSNARLEFGVRVGQRSLIFTATYLSERTVVEDQVFVGAMVSTAAGKSISFERDFPGEIASPTFRRGARIGTGAVIHPHVVIGREAVVAAGAVVFESVPDAVVVLGNPARPVRRVPPREFLPNSDLRTYPS